jgi:predicted amidophosphoribosyltransferase
MHLWITKDLLFPRFCVNCQREGSFLCADCRALLEISSVPNCPCQKSRRTFRCCDCQTSISLSLSAFSVNSYVGQKLLTKFKQGTKDIAPLLADIIIDHLLLLDNRPNLFPYYFKPVPEDIKTVKERGYSVSEELAKELNIRFQSKTKNKTAWVDLVYNQEKVEKLAQAGDISVTVAR